MDESASRNGSAPCITVRDLTMAYGSFVLMRDMSFTVKRGDVFIIMGGSGSGKSTLLRHLIGLNQPAHGSIYYEAENFTTADRSQRERILRNVGVLFQGGALWSAMTLSENIGLLLEEYTDLTPAEIRQVASLKLALVGLKGFEDYYPSRDQRRHAEARRVGSGHGSRSRHPVLRRAVGRPRPDQLAPAGRADPRTCATASA